MCVLLTTAWGRSVDSIDNNFTYSVSLSEMSTHRISWESALMPGALGRRVDNTKT